MSGGPHHPPSRQAVDRRCARPSCPEPAVATLHFRYAERRSWVATMEADPSPQAYDLCRVHADSSRPPWGWVHEDRRGGSAPSGDLPGQGPPWPRQLVLPTEHR